MPCDLIDLQDVPCEWPRIEPEQELHSWELGEV